MAHDPLLEQMQTSGQLHLFGCDVASPLSQFWSAMGTSMNPADQEKCREMYTVLDGEFLIKTVGAMMDLEKTCMEAILLRHPNPRPGWLHAIEYYVGRPFRSLPTNVPGCQRPHRLRCTVRDPCRSSSRGTLRMRSWARS
jgi:hypothetical protein